jgi:SAM-dependent methyltransferase
MRSGPAHDIDADLMKDLVGWDVRTWSAAFEFWQRVVPEAPPALDCLEIGAGPGGPSLWLALQGHRVLCTNQAMTVEIASPLHERYEYPGTITYQTLDARDLPFDAEFDLVVFKSVLGGVGDDAEQERTVASLHRALKPGGHLLFAENIRGTVVHGAARAAMNRRRNANWRFNSLGRLRELLGSFGDVQLRTTGVTALFGTTEPRRAALAGVDRILNPITPPPWRYMAYGVATK